MNHQLRLPVESRAATPHTPAAPLNQPATRPARAAGYLHYTQTSSDARVTVALDDAGDAIGVRWPDSTTLDSSRLSLHRLTHLLLEHELDLDDEEWVA